MTEEERARANALRADINRQDAELAKLEGRAPRPLAEPEQPFHMPAGKRYGDLSMDEKARYLRTQYGPKPAA